MPIFQEEELGNRRRSPSRRSETLSRSPSPEGDRSITRKSSEESIRTDLCEGPVLEGQENGKTSLEEIATSNIVLQRHEVSSRIELMERLKRGESPTWMPTRNLESLLQDSQVIPRNSSPTIETPTLLPSPKLDEEYQARPEIFDQEEAGLQIERPRSALHSGDFTERIEAPSIEHSLQPRNPSAYRSRNSAWIATSPPRHFTPMPSRTRRASRDGHDDINVRSRAPSFSSSYSSSLVLKPPTSPLVQSETNDEIDLTSGLGPIPIDSPWQRNTRRHTLQASHSFQSSPLFPTSSNFAKPLPHLKRDNTYPYQAHQPRRSLSSVVAPLPTYSPQTPAYSRSRRPSYTSDSSPLHHASMVGSYEESILRGRMSTTPSRPLDFVAQIGVLGIGKCKPSLRCPAHITIPFPAVFYSYETTSHGRHGVSEDGPSPYVGQIDIENTLCSINETHDQQRKRHAAASTTSQIDDINIPDNHGASQRSGRKAWEADKPKRRSTSPKAPPGGSYRIPEKGQLQIIIKNPNKTAVKLFLVPYDLAGMESGTKTFIRQRCYSAGPIIDSASSVLQVSHPNTLDRSTLRYLVHLQICSPSRGRFYLYKSIRVVFANRVPDGKERLRNEVSMPEPRFSAYKPGRDNNFGLTMNGSIGASLAADKASRRRSSGFVLAAPNRMYDAGISQAIENDINEGSTFQYGCNISSEPIQPIPFSLYSRPMQKDRDKEDEYAAQPDIVSPISSKGSRSTTSAELRMAMSFDSDSTDLVGYDKLNKGDQGYGGMFSGTFDGKQLIAEGLLAKKLRDFGIGGHVSDDKNYAADERDSP